MLRVRQCSRVTAAVVTVTVTCCKALPIDLADNVDNARYVYLVTVYTGSRFAAGTSSKVYLSLYGELLHIYVSLAALAPDVSLIVMFTCWSLLLSISDICSDFCL